jgi:protein TonB
VSGEVAPGSEARLRPEDFGKSASEVDAPKPVTDTPKPAEPKPLARPAPKKSKPAPEPVQTALANDAPREAPPMSVPAAYPATDATGTAAVARAIDAAKEVAAGASAEPLALRSGNAPPEYPDLARRRGWEGRVVLKVVVDIAGAATDVAIGRTSGFRILDESAVAAVRRWRFEPARLAGIPVVATVDVPVAFRLTD